MATSQSSRLLRRSSERSFDVLVDGVVVAVVWREGSVSDDAKRWRSSYPGGQVELRPWHFSASPQDAARFAVDYLERWGR